MNELTNDEVEAVSFIETMYARCVIDVYAGPNCDEHGEKSWVAWAEGDKEMPGNIGSDIALTADTFRPGTKVQVLEPVCPRCYEPRWLCEDEDMCDFPWKEWDEATCG